MDSKLDPKILQEMTDTELLQFIEFEELKPGLTGQEQLTLSKAKRELFDRGLNNG